MRMIRRAAHPVRPQALAHILELRGITKTFPGVLANDHIDLTLNKGEILALLGENGAGKTTLMNTLYGLYAPDEGQIIIRGQETTIHSPSDAIAQGIGMVHQHFMLVPPLTVTENVVLGDEPVRTGIFLDRRQASRRIQEISTTYGLDVDPNARIRNLPVGVQQRVEIVKVLYRNADILILDEPTAVLTPQEVDDLFRIIRGLIERGKSVIFHPQAQRGTDSGRPGHGSAAGAHGGHYPPGRDGRARARRADGRPRGAARARQRACCPPGYRAGHPRPAGVG